MSESKTTISSEEFEAGIPVHDALSAYQDAVAAQAAVAATCVEWFKGLPLSQKAYVVLTQNHEYLPEENYYCGHVNVLEDDGDGFPTEGAEVSLYDDLYWERHEAQSTRNILDSAFDDWCEQTGKVVRFQGDLEKFKEDRKNLFAEFCVGLETAYGPAAAVARDLLNNNLKAATFDW